MKKITLLILLTSLCINLVFAQKRTTSVKGYYRKNGTYVSPHTRGYTAGSGSTYTSVSSSDKDETSPSDIAPTILKLIRINQGSNKDLRSSEYYNVQGQKVLATKLNFVVQDSISKQTANEEKTSGGVVFYVSVLRYNGKTIDVCPVARSMFSGWDFDKVSHRFQKKDITTEDALDLVSNYGWRISNDEISKDFSYSYTNKGFPKYLTKTIEAINVE